MARFGCNFTVLPSFGDTLTCSKFGGMQTTPLINPPPGGQTTALGGFLTALDLDGKILWQTANPFPSIFPLTLGGSPFAALNVGPVSVANNVVYWPSYDMKGHLIFVDARTGELLGTFVTGRPIGSLESGASVVDGSVYVGSGYAAIPIGFPGPSLVWGLTAPR
jgi:outer membrane protein assembly factor BamB